MIPQSTSLYLVTAFTIDGDRAVSNEMVVGWKDTSVGILPVTIALDSNLSDNTASFASTPARWKKKKNASSAIEFISQFYSDKPLNADEAANL